MIAWIFTRRQNVKQIPLCLIWWLRWIFLELKRLSAGYKAIGELFNLNQKINAATKKALYSMHWWELGNDTIINTWINSSRSGNFIIPENTSYFNQIFFWFFPFFLHHWLNVRVGEGFSGQGKFSVLPKIPRFPMRGRQHWSWQSWIIHFWSLLFGGGPLHGPIFNQQNLWTPSCALVGAERGFDESGFKGLRAKLDHWSFSEHSKRCLWKILVSFNWLRYPVKC